MIRSWATWLKEDHFHVNLGGNTYIDTPDLIIYRGNSLFKLARQDDGYLGIDFHIFDNQGQKIASVKRNNIYFGNKDLYEIEGDADSMILRERSSGTVLATIKKRQDSAPAELDVSVRTYLPNGSLLDASPNSTNLGGVRITGCTFIGGASGIMIE